MIVFILPCFYKDCKIFWMKLFDDMNLLTDYSYKGGKNIKLFLCMKFNEEIDDRNNRIIVETFLQTLQSNKL